MLSGCGGTSGMMYSPVDDVGYLDVSFAAGPWDGATVPTVGICSEGQGKGMSPSLRVQGIPAEADAVVVEFNDTGCHDLMEYGGHGAIWVATEGRTEVVVPSIRERTLELPDGVHMEHAHRAQGFAPGAYLAPCSLGVGHLYEARVMAVRRRAPDGPQLLAEATVSLGVY